MKLADIEINDLIKALRSEQSAWIMIAKEEGRSHSEAEKTTLCMLSALSRALSKLPQP